MQVFTSLLQSLRVRMDTFYLVEHSITCKCAVVTKNMDNLHISGVVMTNVKSLAPSTKNFT